MIELLTVTPNQTYDPAPEVIFVGSVKGVPLTRAESILLGYVTFFRHIKHRTPSPIEVSSYFRQGLPWAIAKLDQLGHKGVLQMPPKRVDLAMNRLDGCVVEYTPEPPIGEGGASKAPTIQTEDTTPLSWTKYPKTRSSILKRCYRGQTTTLITDDGEPCAIVLPVSTAKRLDIQPAQNLAIYNAFYQASRDGKQFWTEREAIGLLWYSRLLAVMVNPSRLDGGAA